jgi:predicted ABC-type ATPase
MPQKRLRVLAGPNGSGKSTLLKHLQSPETGIRNFGLTLNADDCLRALQKNPMIDFAGMGFSEPPEHLVELIRNQAGEIRPDAFAGKDFFSRLGKDSDGLYKCLDEPDNTFAAQLIDALRHVALELGYSLTYETVFSHPGKLEFLKRASHLDYRVYLYFIGTETPEINIERVKERVSKDEHDVPEDKIISRYYRSIDLLPDAIEFVDRCYVFDNSDKSHVLVIEIEKVDDFLEVTQVSETIPKWLEPLNEMFS